MNGAMAAARTLLRARDEQRRLSLVEWRASGLDPTDEAGGYAIQAGIEQIRTGERGERRIGYKIGATNAAARDLLSVATPFYGRLYDRTSEASPATVRLVEGLHLVLEPEIVVELGTNLRPSDAPFDAEALERATRTLRPAIEIVATCLDPWLEAGAPSLIADNAVHGHWITGDPVSDWSKIDILNDPVTVTINGKVAATGAGHAVDGGAFGAAAWLATRLATEGRGLATAEFISTRTVTQPVAVAPGQAIEADFGALGNVSLQTET